MCLWHKIADSRIRPLQIVCTPSEYTRVYAPPTRVSKTALAYNLHLLVLCYVYQSTLTCTFLRLLVYTYLYFVTCISLHLLVLCYVYQSTLTCIFLRVLVYTYMYFFTFISLHLLVLFYVYQSTLTCTLLRVLVYTYLYLLRLLVYTYLLSLLVLFIRIIKMSLKQPLSGRCMFCFCNRVQRYALLDNTHKNSTARFICTCRHQFPLQSGYV